MFKQKVSSKNQVNINTPRIQMLQIALIVLVYILLLFGCASFNNARKMDGNESKRDVLTVMTFNIRHGCGVKNWGVTTSHFFKTCGKNLNSVAAAIASVNPDLVGLQEVDQGQVRTLARKLNMNFTFFTHNPAGYGGWWGNAILSKQAILESTRTSIGGITNRNRSMVSAKIELNGRNVTVICVHIHHQLYSTKSVRKIVDYIEENPDPVILVGDFNMLPFDSRWKEINLSGRALSRVENKSGVYGRIFVDTVEGALSNDQNDIKVNETLPGKGRIDYILIEKDFFDVHDAKLVPRQHRNASDHYAYYAIISPKWK